MSTTPHTNGKGQRICGAKTRRPPGTCQSRALIAPSYRCRMHGGTAKRGVESPAFRHGRYAATMPNELRELFTAARRDPQVLDLTDDVALATATIGWLLKRWASGEECASETLMRVRSAWTAMKAANTSNDHHAVSVAAVQMDDALRAAPAKLESVRAEIARQQTVKRRVVETMLKADVMSQTVIPVVQAQQVMVALVEAFFAIVTDPAQRDAIKRAFQQVMNVPLSAVTLQAGDAGPEDGTEDR